MISDWLWYFVGHEVLYVDVSGVVEAWDTCFVQDERALALEGARHNRMICLSVRIWSVVAGLTVSNDSNNEDEYTLSAAVNTPLPPDPQDMKQQKRAVNDDECDIGTQGWAEEAQRRQDEMSGRRESEDPFRDPTTPLEDSSPFVVGDGELVSPVEPRRV
ncbi:hypothetical protein N0V90_009622 [Kalmusia sp. IMI 367209]|nr:hypothetical protein N0V90_009622 [Kalmusia sp. IMI 367209]